MIAVAKSNLADKEAEARTARTAAATPAAEEAGMMYRKREHKGSRATSQGRARHFWSTSWGRAKARPIQKSAKRDTIFSIIFVKGTFMSGVDDMPDAHRQSWRYARCWPRAVARPMSCARRITRVTGKLLAAFGIEKRLERLDEAMQSARAPKASLRACWPARRSPTAATLATGRVCPTRALRLVRARPARRAPPSRCRRAPRPRPRLDAWPVAARTRASISVAFSRARPATVKKAALDAARRARRGAHLL